LYNVASCWLYLKRIIWALVDPKGPSDSCSMRQVNQEAQHMSMKFGLSSFKP
jgi:hypothetical protein